MRFVPRRAPVLVQAFQEHLLPGCQILSRIPRRIAHHGAQGGFQRSDRFERFVPLLFAEANPMPIKYCLWRQGLITSPECRLPLTRISATLARQLDGLLADRKAA